MILGLRVNAQTQQDGAAASLSHDRSDATSDPAGFSCVVSLPTLHRALVYMVLTGPWATVLKA